MMSESGWHANDTEKVRNLQSIEDAIGDALKALDMDWFAARDDEGRELRDAARVELRQALGNLQSTRLTSLGSSR